MATGKRILDQTAINVTNIIKESGVISATSVFVKNVLKQHTGEIGLVLSDDELGYVASKVQLSSTPVSTSAPAKGQVTFKELKAVLDEISEPIEAAWSNLDDSNPTGDNEELSFALEKLEETIKLFDKVNESHFNNKLKEQFEPFKANFKVYKDVSEKLDEIKLALMGIFEEINEEYDLNI